MFPRSRTPRKEEQAHSSFLKWTPPLNSPACICVTFHVFATYRHLHLKMLFWDASVTFSRKMQINVDFCYYQLHQNKQTEAGTLLEFDKSMYLNAFPRGLGKTHLIAFPITDNCFKRSYLRLALVSPTLRPPPSLVFLAWELLFWFLKCNRNKW